MSGENSPVYNNVSATSAVSKRNGYRRIFSDISLKTNSSTRILKFLFIY